MSYHHPVKEDDALKRSHTVARDVTKVSHQTKHIHQIMVRTTLSALYQTVCIHATIYGSDSNPQALNRDRSNRMTQLENDKPMRYSICRVEALSPFDLSYCPICVKVN